MGGSEAQKQLLVDVKCGMHKLMKPRILWAYREVYQTFDPDLFRAHIYQQVRSELETPYWIVKKKRKMAKYAERMKATEVDDDDDVDFFTDYN